MAESPVHKVAEVAKNNPLIALATAVGLLTSSLGGLAFGYQQIDSIKAEQTLMKQENADVIKEIRAKSDAAAQSASRTEGFVEAMFKMKKAENEAAGKPVIEPDTLKTDSTKVDSSATRPR